MAKKRTPTEAARWEYFERARWPKGCRCPRCGAAGAAPLITGRKRFRRCLACNAQFSPFMGTPLQGTHLSLRTIFSAATLIRQGGVGIPATTLARELGVAYNTARSMKRRILATMAQNDGLYLALSKKGIE